jgi:hypothetical protein
MRFCSVLAAGPRDEVLRAAVVEGVVEVVAPNWAPTRL